MRRTFRAKILVATLALVAAAELLTVVAIDRAIASDFEDRLAMRMEEQARGAIEWASQGRNPDVVAGRLASITATRVTLIDARGIVVGDSAQLFEDVRSAPEVSAARGGGVGRSTRASSSQKERVLHIAVASPEGLVVRLAAPLADVERARGAMRERLLLASAVVFLLAVTVSMGVARALARPLLAMRDVAQRIARGSYDVQLGQTGRDELGDLQRSLQQLAEQLAATEARRREFVGDLSHEIGTPVAAIQGYAETLLAGPVDAPTSKEFLEIIHRHARRIDLLVADLRFLSAQEARPADARVRVPVRVHDVAMHVQSALLPRTEERGARVVLELEPTLEVLGDPEHLERVLLNLVENAVKYARGTITVTGRRTPSGGQIEVIDTGPGIAAEHLPRLFERFYRVDRGRSRESGGTGLGLAIVKRLVEDMGGTVEVDSKVGEGTRFTVRLPLV